jgi:hypothetical protein
MCICMYVCTHVCYTVSTLTGPNEFFSVRCQEGNKSLHLFRPAGHTCRRRCRTCTAMWYWIAVISLYMAINCEAHNGDTRLFTFEVRRAVVIAVTSFYAFINHSLQNQWQCLMKTKTRKTHCAHSSVANVLFKVDRCYLSARKTCNFILLKHEVMRNKIGLSTIVS